MLFIWWQNNRGTIIHLLPFYHSFPANVLFRMSFISKDETLDSWLLHVYKTYRLLYIVVKHEQSLNTQFPKKILHTKIAYFEFLKFTKQNFTEWTLKSVCQQSTSQQWKLGPSRKKTWSWTPTHTSFLLNKQINTHSYREMCSKNAGAWIITHTF